MKLLGVGGHFLPHVISELKNHLLAFLCFSRVFSVKVLIFGFSIRRFSQKLFQILAKILNFSGEKSENFLDGSKNRR